MSSLIPPAKRSYPGGGLDQNKRMTLYPGSKVPGAGFKETLDASFFDPADTANTPGMGPNSSTDLMDQEVNIKISVVNTQYPPGNDFVTKFPQGCALFIRAPDDRTEREKDMTEANGVTTYSDLLLAATPEQLRYYMHYHALDNKARGTCRPPTLTDAIKSWKFFGICDQKPTKANYASANFSTIQHELQWIKTLHRSTQAKMINYWKKFGIDGQKRSYLWWKIQEVDISKETAYVLGTERDGSPIYYLGNKFMDEDAAQKEAVEAYQSATVQERGQYTEQQAKDMMCTVRYVPAFVPLATQTRSLKKSDLAYEITLPSGKKLPKFGYAIFVGRCTRRSMDRGEDPEDYDYVDEKKYDSYRSTRDACTNMAVSDKQVKIDLILHATSKIFG